MDFVLQLPQLLGKSSPGRSKLTSKAKKPADREWPVNADEYEVLGQAGKGAHAVVYRACCKPFNQLVAIKKLNLDSNSNWDLGALVREATLMKRLHHPNLLELHTSFVVGRQLWMVTPFMGLGSVRGLMKRHFPQGLDEVAIATIMRFVLLGLEYVHKSNGIHRDVKADNILLSEEGAVVLADFGVAAARGGRNVSLINMDMGAVMATTFVGTPCWMAPEVMRQDDGYNSAADIWSFGITLIELAQGRPPLARLHPMRVLMDTMHKPPPSLDDHPTGQRFSKAFKEAVEACLQKDPSQRPSASSLLNHRFFKAMARDKGWLVPHLLSRLPEGEEVGGAAAAAGPGKLRGASVIRQAAAGKEGMSFAAACRLMSGWYFPQQQQQQLEQIQQHQEEEEEEHESGAVPEPATAVIPTLPESASAAAFHAGMMKAKTQVDELTREAGGLQAASQQLLPMGDAADMTAASRTDEIAAAAAAPSGGADAPCHVEVQVMLSGQQQWQQQQKKQQQQQHQASLQLRAAQPVHKILRKAASAGASPRNHYSQHIGSSSSSSRTNRVKEIWGGLVRALSRGSSWARHQGRDGSWSSSESGASVTRRNACSSSLLDYKAAAGCSGAAMGPVRHGAAAQMMVATQDPEIASAAPAAPAALAAPAIAAAVSTTTAVQGGESAGMSGELPMMQPAVCVVADAEDDPGLPEQREQQESFSMFAEKPRMMPAWCDGSRHHR